MKKLKKELKELIKEITLEGREVFCEEREDVGNRYYIRDLIGEIEDIKTLRTRKKNFRPTVIKTYSRTSSLIEGLIVAIYQYGCSIGDVTRI